MGSGNDTQEVTKNLTIQLDGDVLPPYKLTVKLDGAIVYETTILEAQDEITISLTGKGVKYYKVYINDMNPWIEEVDFTN